MRLKILIPFAVGFVVMLSFLFGLSLEFIDFTLNIVLVSLLSGISAVFLVLLFEALMPRSRKGLAYIGLVLAGSMLVVGVWWSILFPGR